MAMGAEKGVLLADEAFEGSDGRGVARILGAHVRKNPCDLILTGVQADDGAAQVGGMLAAMLDYPFASLVTDEAVYLTKLPSAEELKKAPEQRAPPGTCWDAARPSFARPFSGPRILRR